MDIAAAFAADLAALADATSDGGDGLRESLDGLRRSARTAVVDYVGLTVTVAHSDGPLTLQVLEAGAASDAAVASLHLLLGPLYGARPGSTLTLFSGRRGAFDVLAGELQALSGADPAAVVVDGHVAGRQAGPNGPTMADASLINQAIGVLHERGFGSVAQARAELARLAVRDGMDVAAAAHALVNSVIHNAAD
jgi:hypothetical protein